MKHSFQNLNIDSKKKVARIGRDTFEDIDFEDEMEDLASSHEKVKAVHNSYRNKYTSFEDRIVDATDHGFYKVLGDEEKLEGLIEDVLREGLTYLDKSKDWEALLKLLTDDFGSKLRKEQKELDKDLEKLQYSVKIVMYSTKALYKWL